MGRGWEAALSFVDFVESVLQLVVCRRGGLIRLLSGHSVGGHLGFRFRVCVFGHSTIRFIRESYP